MNGETSDLGETLLIRHGVHKIIDRLKWNYPIMFLVSTWNWLGVTPVNHIRANFMGFLCINYPELLSITVFDIPHALVLDAERNWNEKKKQTLCNLT